MNRVTIIGRLTADPELRQTQSGVSSCRFTVAVDRRFADKNTGERQADFITCIAWRQTAEFVSRYFNKGKMIALEGTLRTGKYTDKQHSDVTHYTTDVFVENVEFCGDKGNPQQAVAATAAPSAAQAVVDKAQDQGIPIGFEELLNDGDMPF